MYGKMKRQEELREFVNNDVYVNQSMLVDRLLDRGVLGYEDIENLYYTREDLLEDMDQEEAEEAIENGDDMKEIFEWWVVSDWLLDQLQAIGQPVLITDFGSWWGRTCTGQPIFMDHIIDRIYYQH